MRKWTREIGPHLTTLLGKLGLLPLTGRRETPEVSKGGAYDIGGTDFRKACAILADGTVCFVKAYNTAEIAVELAQLRGRYDLPDETDRRPVTLAEMGALYGEERSERVTARASAGQLRMQRVLSEAAALGASDIKLIERGTHGLLRIKVGAGEFTHGAEWRLDEAVEGIKWIYDYRDGGSGQPTLVKGASAQFSIGQAGKLPGMPPGISAFRGQIAWHANQLHFLNLRLLPEATAQSYGDLAGLGLDQDILDALAAERRSDTGLVILGGSTGDGKSTTLVRHLEKLYEERNGKISICTIEDPIEYPAIGDGVVQFAVVPGETPEERSANYSRALMVFVRINPDVGMVSEIRSANDVNEVLHFVTSGHKVYTTVHANSAGGVLPRMIAFGVRPEELAGPDVVNSVLRQKLVPQLCPHCAEPLSGPAHAKVEDWLGEDPLFAARGAGPLTLLRRNPAGCEHCLAPYAKLTGPLAATARAAWAGYARRRATAELIRLDNDYRKLVVERDQIGAMEYWLTPVERGGMGGIPIETRLRRLVAQGVTDYEYVTNEVLPDPPRAIAGPVRQDGGRKT